MKYDLVQKWEKTRHEQAKIILQEEETKLTAIHQQCDGQIDREQIAIGEIECFIKYKIEKLLGMIKYWEGKYRADVTDLDRHIKETKDSIIEVEMKIGNIKERHGERKKFIDKYREEQRILMEKRKFEEKQKNSAISIQVYIYINVYLSVYTVEIDSYTIFDLGLVARRNGTKTTGPLSSEEKE